jgi:hypothetical protein
MNRTQGRAARAGGLLALALAAIGLLALPAGAAAKDRNRDHIPDRWEKRHHLSLAVNQARRDQDGDHLRNLAEFRAGDNPRDRDSDDDGVIDGEENAGTVASFDAVSGRLVIDLFGGESLSGLVDESTRIECEGPDDSATVSRDHGSGEGESGDDRGEGTEPGDDSGGNSGPGSTSDNSGPGSNSSGPGGGDDDQEAGNCTAAALVPGTVVQEAELRLDNGVATYEEVELAHTAG